MQALFSPDSKFMRAMSRIGDLLVLNFFFLLCCVPIVTIGAAVTAMYTVCFRFGTEREHGVIGAFFRSFRDNFRQATALWLLVLLCGGTAAVNTVLFYGLAGPVRYGFVLFAILFVLVVLAAGYLFPLVSQFSNNSKSVLRNALILSLGYLPRSLVTAALNVFPFVLLLTDLYYFLQAAFIWVALYFSAAAYLNTFLLKKVFAPYLTETEEEAL